MNPRPSGGNTFRTRFGTLFLVLVLSCANFLLCDPQLPFTLRSWTFLAGVLLPFMVEVLRKGPSPWEGLSSWDTAPRGGLFLLVLALGTVVRLLQVIFPGKWPSWDDGRFAYYSVELLHHWHWKVLFSPTQHPPFFNWGLAFFYRLVPPSLASLWLFPALLSIGALFLFAWTARELLSPLAAFLAVALMAFSFWPLYVGKYCMYMVALLFWESLTFAAGVLALQDGSRRPRTGPFLLFGLCAGLGFWVAIAWPVVALVACLAVGFRLKGSPRKGTIIIGSAFLLPCLLPCGLFYALSFAAHNGIHVGQLWAFSGPMDPVRQAVDSLSNVTVLLWGCDLQNAYGPVQGGVLDPLEGAFLLVAFLAFLRSRKSPWETWAALSFLILMAPGMMTRNFDLFRNTQLIPLLVLATAQGGCLFFSSLRPRTRSWSLPVALALCALWDMGQLVRTYLPTAGNANRPSSLEMERAFPILGRQAARSGPGEVLFELKPMESDLTLAIATYRFNATVDPDLDPARVRWTAILTDVQYRPYLEKRFADASFFPLFDPAHPAIGSDNGMLMIVPATGEHRKVLAAWRRADQVYRKLVWDAVNLPENDHHRGLWGTLERIRSLFLGDPFLGSLYWSAVYDFHNWENRFGDQDHVLHGPAAFNAIAHALKEGYPIPYFWNEWGTFLAMKKDRAGAQKAFLKATQGAYDFTPARENLEALRSLPREQPGTQNPKRSGMGSGPH